MSDLKYYPLPDFNMLSESQCIIDANQEDFLNRVVKEINKYVDASQSIVPDKIKEVIPEVAFYVVQYFITKFTRANSLNIMVYYISGEDDKIHFIPKNDTSIELLSNELYNYIVDSISKSGIFTQYWEDFTPFIKVSIDRSVYQLTTSSRKDFERQFEFNHDDTFILKLLESNLKSYEKERDVLTNTSASKPNTIRLAEVNDLINRTGIVIENTKKQIAFDEEERRNREKVKEIPPGNKKETNYLPLPPSSRTRAPPQGVQPQGQQKQGQPQGQPQGQQKQAPSQPQAQNKLPPAPQLKPVPQQSYPSSYASINNTSTSSPPPPSHNPKQKDDGCSIF